MAATSIIRNGGCTISGLRKISALWLPIQTAFLSQLTFLRNYFQVRTIHKNRTFANCNPVAETVQSLKGMIVLRD